MRSFPASALILSSALLVAATSFAQQPLPVSPTPITAGLSSRATISDPAVAITPAGLPEVEAAPATPATRRTLAVRGTWLLSDGPLTVEIRDLNGRPLLRQSLSSAPANEDLLELPAPALPVGTYSVRVLDARGMELSRQTVAYQPR